MNFTDKAIQASTAAVVIGVAGVAAYLSYEHAYELVSSHGESGAPAAVMPATIDGLIFSASMVLLDAARNGRGAPALARWTLALGIGASLAANVMHGINAGVIGAIVAGWPALALILVYELLMKLIRDGARAERGDSPHIRTVADLPQSEAVDLGPLPGDDTDDWPDTPETLVNWLDGETAPPSETAGLDEDQAVTDARERFADALSTGAVPSVRALKRELHVGWNRAKQVQAALSGSA